MARDPLWAATTPTLQAKASRIRQKISRLQTRSDVADLLEIKTQYLNTILYKRKSRDKYKSFSIGKSSGGSRKIHSPPRDLSILQSKLLQIFSLYPPMPVSCQGFTTGRSILSNSSFHYNKRWILNLDLQNFFPSIHIGRIIKVLQLPPFSFGPEAATTIAQLCTMGSGKLPQGGRTSPFLANRVSSLLDTKLTRIAARNNCWYTRYADDITFSTNRSIFPHKIAWKDDDGYVNISTQISSAIHASGFKVKAGKTKLRNRNQRQQVTGLVVNEFPNVPRNYIREIRSFYADAFRRGVKAASMLYCQNRNIVCRDTDYISTVSRIMNGKLAYIRYVRGDADFVSVRYQRIFSILFGKPFSPPSDEQIFRPQPIRGRRSKSSNWPSWVRKYQYSIYALELLYQNNEKGMATAFRISDHQILTAGHCLEGLESPLNANATIFDPIDSVPIDGIAFLNEAAGGIDIGICDCLGLTNIASHPIPTQERCPEIGEEIATIGYPSIPTLDHNLSCHVGYVESIGFSYQGTGGASRCFIIGSFAAGGGLSGSPVFDKSGYAIGLVVGNAYMKHADGTSRSYSKILPIAYWRHLDFFPRWRR